MLALISEQQSIQYMPAEKQWMTVFDLCMQLNVWTVSCCARNILSLSL